MYKISKRFDFSASHQLEGLPEGHQCGRLHGHNYSVTVHLVANELNEVGFIRDYGELDCVKKYLDEYHEHRHLNETMLGMNPTAENLARDFFETFESMIPELIGVTVKETDKTEATYTRERVFIFNDA